MLRRVEVKGYKCLRYIAQRLSPFHILVGPNASGKSAFLDVVLFVRDLIDKDVEQAVRSRARSLRELVWKGEEDHFEIALEFQLPKDIRVLRNGHTYTGLRYEVRIREEENGLQIPVENLWLISEKGGEETKPQPRQLDLFPQERHDVPETIVVEPERHAPKGWRKVMSRSREGRVYVRSERTDWNMPLKPIAGRSGLTIIPEEEERFPAAVWLRRLFISDILFVMLDSRAMRKSVPPDAPRTFQPTGANLARALEALQQEDKQNFRRWLQHLQTVLTDLTDLEVAELPENRFRYIVATFAGGAKVPSWLLSDGSLRVMALTLLPYLPTPQGVYFVEEPENGVHPKVLEAIYQSLSSVYNGQVLCATHSPVFLNLAKPEELLCFARTESGATDIVSGDKHPRLKEWREEVSLGDLLVSGVLG